MKLSLVIPYFNARVYTDELLDRLDPQITNEVEVIIVDDGSPEPYKTAYPWAKVIRKRNGGCASARNRGLKVAKGEYISFIDADDMVPEYFIEKLLKKAEGGYDVIDFSWKSLTSAGNQHNYILRSDNDRLPNPSVCTRAFKRSFIGENRFNEKKDSTEDEDFSRKLGYLDRTKPIKHGSIPEYMYFYRTALDNSKIKRFKKGIMKTKRIVYYFERVTADMTDLLDEIRREDENNEVWLLTKRCDIPEMSRYCQIHKPMHIWGHYLRGEETNLVEVIDPPASVQVVVYIEFACKVGGITTFIYNFCQHMRKYYDIMVLYGELDKEQAERLSRIVRIKKNDVSEPIVCDTFILNRLTDTVPVNVICKKTVQMCHACVQINYRIPQNRDYLINVSEAAKESWGEESADGIVIHNLAYIEAKKAILLISATRVNTMDKGTNDGRMRKLAEMLEMEKIPYVWLNFADKRLGNMPKNFINMPAVLNIQDYIARADYLVQLSDKEAYSMSILEALTNNTAVIATPFPSLYEEGFVEGVNGYTVPFDMNFDVRKLLKVPKFEYEYDNKSIIAQWRKIIGAKTKKKPIKSSVVGPASLPGDVSVLCTKKYYDKALGKYVKGGEIIRVPEGRAEKICSMGYGRRV